MVVVAGRPDADRALMPAASMSMRLRMAAPTGWQARHLTAPSSSTSFGRHAGRYCSRGLSWTVVRTSRAALVGGAVGTAGLAEHALDPGTVLIIRGSSAAAVRRPLRRQTWQRRRHWYSRSPSSEAGQEPARARQRPGVVASASMATSSVRAASAAPGPAPATAHQAAVQRVRPRRECGRGIHPHQHRDQRHRQPQRRPSTRSCVGERANRRPSCAPAA